jgi:glucosamine-6-phosphate deaminase
LSKCDETVKNGATSTFGHADPAVNKVSLPKSIMSESSKSSALESFQVDQLKVNLYGSQEDLAGDVTQLVRQHLKNELEKRETVAVILATGNSQIQFLKRLADSEGIDWSRIILFHMDEYLGISADHTASFQRYMKERVESRLKPGKFNYIQGDALEPIAECERYTRLLEAQPISLCCLGVGENGHIAFNDPPVADLQDPRKVKLVKLDDACMKQQVGEGHFPNMDSVPKYAITLTIPMLCQAEKMLCISPESRKAEAVKAALEGPITKECPASALRSHSDATLFIDKDSANLLIR